ncbi:MAG: DUF4249 family protein [Polaribacter sp.]
MKKIFFIIPVLIFLFTSCEKVVEIDVPSIAPKLIIDASFEVYFTQNTVTASTVVKLTQSADYFDETIPPVTNATVTITDLSDNSMINFTDILGNGNYTPNNSFVPKENTEYELTVVHNNQTYKGKASRVKSTPIIDVNQGDKGLFPGTVAEIKVKIQDQINVNNYYFFDFSANNYSVLEDRFFDGQEYEVPNFYQEDEIEFPTTVTIKMLGISKAYFTYMRILISQSGQNGGGPFETVPTSLLGNMINTTNDANFPLGFFHIGEASTYDIKLVDKN